MWLKKYTAIFKISFKESLAYRFDVFASSLLSFFKVYLAYLLWRAIFGEKEIINGYTFPMMLSYYIIIFFIEHLARSESIIWETSDEVRTGSFTKYLSRPLRHFGYCLSKSAGKCVFTLILDLLAFTVWIIVFRKYFFFPGNPLVILYSAGFIVLGLFTMMQLHYLVALVSFKTIEIAGPFFLIFNFVNFMSGSFIPLSLLPGKLEQILSFTPFYYIFYFPAAVYLGQGLDQLGKALLVVMAWNLFFALFRKFFFRRMIAVYEGVGA